MLKFVSLLVVLAVVRYSQCGGDSPDPCLVPKQLTFKSVVRDFNYPYGAKHYVEYDLPNQRVVMFEDAHGPSSRQARKFVLLHSQSTGYDVNFLTKKCTKFHIGPFEAFGVLPNSTFEGQQTIGGPYESILVYRYSKKDKSGRDVYIQTFTAKGCYPISSFLADENDFNKSRLSEIYDVVLGITNPDDFDLPAYCNQSSVTSRIPREVSLALSVVTNTLRN